MTTPEVSALSADTSPDTLLTGGCQRQLTPIYGTPLADTSLLTPPRPPEARGLQARWLPGMWPLAAGRWAGGVRARLTAAVPTVCPPAVSALVSGAPWESQSVGHALSLALAARLWRRSLAAVAMRPVTA